MTLLAAMTWRFRFIRVPNVANGLVHPAAVAGGRCVDRNRSMANIGNLFRGNRCHASRLVPHAELFTAGDIDPVNDVLRKLVQCGSHMRTVNLGETVDPSIAEAVGMTIAEMESMYRLLAITSTKIVTSFRRHTPKSPMHC